ncbi:MAG: GNAT family N-acetyltransferase [Rhodothermales bacterium]
MPDLERSSGGGVPEVHLRPAQTADSAPIAELSGTLGYPVSETAVAERLDRLLPRESDVILVAEGADGRIVGWIHGGELDLLESGRRGEILGLVVDPEHRNQGIGRMLVEAVESWAVNRGHHMISVRSNVLRPEAHPFYERLGYRRVKTQHVYRKGLIIKD